MRETLPPSQEMSIDEKVQQAKARRDAANIALTREENELKSRLDNAQSVEEVRRIKEGAGALADAWLEFSSSLNAWIDLKNEQVVLQEAGKENI